MRTHGPITSSVRRLGASLGEVGFCHAWLILVLVAVAALSTVNLVGPQDRRRYELARHVLLDHSLTIERDLFDSARFHGRSGRDELSKTLWAWTGVNRIAGAAILLTCALAAVGIGGQRAVRRGERAAVPA